MSDQTYVRLSSTLASISTLICLAFDMPGGSLPKFCLVVRELANRSFEHTFFDLTAPLFHFIFVQYLIHILGLHACGNLVLGTRTWCGTE